MHSLFSVSIHGLMEAPASAGAAARRCSTAAGPDLEAGELRI
jgi:hypothetical protein